MVRQSGCRRRGREVIKLKTSGGNHSGKLIEKSKWSGSVSTSLTTRVRSVPTTATGICSISCTRATRHLSSQTFHPTLVYPFPPLLAPILWCQKFLPPLMAVPPSDCQHQSQSGGMLMRGKGKTRRKGEEEGGAHRLGGARGSLLALDVYLPWVLSTYLCVCVTMCMCA